MVNQTLFSNEPENLDLLIYSNPPIKVKDKNPCEGEGTDLY